MPVRYSSPLVAYLSIEDTDTHAAQHLPLADYIIIIGQDGKIAEQGTWDDLRASAGYISQVVLGEKHHDSDSSRDNSRTRESFQTPAAKKPKEELEDLTRKTGDFTLYSKFSHFLSPLSIAIFSTKPILTYLQATTSG